MRPLIYVGVKPQSQSFATAQGAVEAVTAGSWTLAALDSVRARFRIVPRHLAGPGKHPGRLRDT